MARLAGKASKPSSNRHRRTSNRQLLLRRLEHFSFNNNIDDLDACVDYLRHNYKSDYGRLKLRPFSKLVEDSIRDLKQQQQKNRSLKSSSYRESRLQLLEDGHSRRLQCDPRSDATSSDNSVDEEEPGDRRQCSEGENRVDCVYGGREDHGSDEELLSREKRKNTKARKEKVARSGFGSESADEDEVIEPDSGFNLLNASLCGTYTINCTNSFNHEHREEPQNIPREDEHHNKTTLLSEVDKVAAFASPSAIIAAARAAQDSTKKHGNIPSNDSLVANLMDAEDAGGQSTEVHESNEKHALESKGTSTSKVVDLPISKNGKAEKSGMKKRPRQTDNQEKDITTSTAEAVRFSDLGGIDHILELLREIMFPLYNPGIYSWLGVEPIRGILLHGPPGCGKTKLANAIAFEAGLPFLKLSGPEVVSGMSGESEAKIRGLFTEALRLAPCIIFIDEIDSITSKRENAQREMERRIVTQLMTCMDELNQAFQKGTEVSAGSSPNKEYSKHVLVIGATNRPEALDPALRRPGRFDREISLSVPDENARAQILSVLAKHLRVEGTFDFKHIARCTPGFVGADLAALTREAGSIAIKRIVSGRNPDARLPKLTASINNLKEDLCINIRPMDNCVDGSETRSSQETSWWKTPWSQDEMQKLSIIMQDFEEAIALVQPSTKREGFSSIPNVNWEDVGALDSIQNMMEFFISRRIKHPEDYEELGLDMDTGFLLYGPPGCGKTLVAKAVANDAQANFIYIKGPELLNKYVGESEQAVRALFSRARSCAPCILFFDEMDALAPRRGTDGNAVAERVLNQLLSEMDGAEKRRGVFMIGATNRPDMIDPAILRPGRLGKLLYVPLPDAGGRLAILKTLTRHKPVASDVDLVSISSNKHCEGLSGADLAALVNEACVAALQEKCLNPTTCELLLVHKRHFETALSQILPSVSREDLIYYDSLPKKFNRISKITTMKGIASGPCI